MGDIDELLNEELKDPEFAKAWEQTELEYQIKRMLISARIENNMTQKELAEKSGVRQSNISRIEKGVCVPTLTTLNELAKGLGKKLRIELI
ncbi:MULTISPECIES: helix-turn-helix domain-containing protein [unclassified Butyrivibrio]|jgi:DNA-binding XRE family transcriptional regulator|uniref:helix-turn-helix domain-containing protein n=1 Tax=unclassified Butyrivibrio TaxID=2639466 RepID=UPI0003B62B37|nr:MULTISPECIES: helix-turn-helix transcriptional regulator [unclassified Butyrivibrio]MDC7294558.1 helix-turn-helix domain-containing protein [Butyrivibrio sp. DSM 10294]